MFEFVEKVNMCIYQCIKFVYDSYNKTYKDVIIYIHPK